jgi:two-component system alkaline phosphatase synthesis response regulator PhoP
MEILIAGIEPLGKIWEEAFSLRGWKILRSPDFKGALGLMPQPPGAVIFLESILPDARSLSLIREKGPGLSLLVASRIQNAARLIELLNSGADDVVSPDMPGELLSAKLEAVFRRFGKTEASKTLKSQDGKIEIDHLRRKALLNKKTLDLTKTEFDLLSLIMERPGVALERRTLLQLMRSDSDSLQSSTIDKHVESLRKKLGDMGGCIKTVHGIGYAWELRKNGEVKSNG